MMKLAVSCLVLIFGGWIVGICHGSPTKVVIASASDTEESPTAKTPKPRCLLSLFGLDSSNAPVLPDYNSSPLQGTGMGLQGGILSSNNDYGFGGSNYGGNNYGGSNYGTSSSGLGLPSQYTPGLGQAFGAIKQALGMENQLYATQSHINSQLAGVPGSGIPLSSGFLRNGPSGLTSLPAPPSLSYGFRR